jgi:putative transposase
LRETAIERQFDRVTALIALAQRCLEPPTRCLRRRLSRPPDRRRRRLRLSWRQIRPQAGTHRDPAVDGTFDGGDRPPPHKAITEELCGHSFSASAISDATARLDGMLTAFAERRLSEAYPYLILDARYERIREAGRSRARRCWSRSASTGKAGAPFDKLRVRMLGVELANRESRSSWRDFLAGLKARGLYGVEFVVSDNHDGLKAAIREMLPEAVWQRCYVHFLRNALDYVPRKVDDDCLMELRWFYDRRDLAEVRRDPATWLAKWQGKYPKLTSWVEDNLEETLTYYRLPLPHHKHMKSTNMLERLNQELKRRTLVVRIFPNATSCLRLVRALAVETHESWLEATRHLNMEHLRERKKEALRAIAA